MSTTFFKNIIFMHFVSLLTFVAPKSYTKYTPHIHHKSIKKADEVTNYYSIDFSLIIHFP